MGLDVALAADSVSKRFGATRALVDASLMLRGGEVHGLVGTNGSGKSTMIKIVTGIYAPDTGELSLWGNRISLPVRRPTDIGIAVVHQRLGLQDNATVTESVGSGVGYGRRVGYFVSWRSERRRCRALAERLGVDIDPNSHIGELPPAQRTVVAIMRALRNISSTGERHVLILDEPTVSMSPREVAILQAVLRRLTDAGDAVLLVSHRLGEVLNLCRRVTILRDGCNQGCYDAATLDETTLLRHMLGADPVELPPVTSPDDLAAAALTARGLSGDQLQNLNVELRRERIVGFTGLVGSGHDEIPYLVGGSVTPSSGTLTADGRELPRGVAARMRQGVVVVPGDGARQGLWLQAHAAENISLPVLRSFFRNGRLSRRREAAHARSLMTNYGIKPVRPTATMETFSGGNQQKVVLAKAMQSQPSVVVLHEPTVGVDANAKRQIYGLVRDAAARGTAIAVCSTDYEELAEYCDRIYVVRDGRVVTILDGPGLSESVIVAACNSSRPGTELVRRVSGTDDESDRDDSRH